MSVRTFLLIAIGFLLGALVCVYSHDAKSQQRGVTRDADARLAEFAQLVKRAEKELPAPGGIAVSIDDGQMTADEWPARIFKLPPQLSLSFGSFTRQAYAIKILRRILEHAGNNYLALLATHEACHVKLGHPIGEREMNEAEEQQANTCACEFLKEDACIDAFSELGHYHGIPGIYELPREELKRRVMGLYGGMLNKK